VLGTLVVQRQKNIFETVQQLKKIKYKNELASYKKNARTAARQNKKMTSLEGYCIYMFAFFFLFPVFFFLLSGDNFCEKNFYSYSFFFICNNKNKRIRHDVSVDDVDHLPSSYCQFVKCFLLLIIYFYLLYIL